MFFNLARGLPRKCESAFLSCCLAACSSQSVWWQRKRKITIRARWLAVPSLVGAGFYLTVPFYLAGRKTSNALGHATPFWRPFGPSKAIRSGKAMILKVRWQATPGLLSSIRWQRRPIMAAVWRMKPEVTSTRRSIAQQHRRLIGGFAGIVVPRADDFGVVPNRLDGRKVP